MKSIAAIVLLLVSSFAAAQDKAAVNAAKAACGDSKETFAATEIKAQPGSTPAALPAPPPGKARIYFVEAQDIFGVCIDCHITVRAGLDGGWIGATKGNSYLSFDVDPGDHHLCANWQSKLAPPKKKTSLAGFTAESGKTYFFKVHVFGGTPETLADFSLEPVNADEAKLLMASSATTQWKKK
jgi:hypothetical protein